MVSVGGQRTQEFAKQLLAAVKTDRELLDKTINAPLLEVNSFRNTAAVT